MNEASCFEFLLPASSLDALRVSLSAISGESLQALDEKPQSLSLHVPLDAAVTTYAHEYDEAFPIPGQLRIGPLWASLCSFERVALLRLSASSPAMSILFRDSGAVQQTLKALAQEWSALALFLDSGAAQVQQLWPGDGAVTLPAGQALTPQARAASLLETVTAQAPLRRFELVIPVTEEDRPEDKFSHHVNNARYAVFINRTLQRWYVPMGLRGALPDFSAMMARSEYDFLHEVAVPGEVTCLLQVSRVGRSSLEHRVEMWSTGTGDARLVGRGRLVHVGIDRQTRKSRPWPPEVLALCWPAKAAGSAPPVA